MTQSVIEQDVDVAIFNSGFNQLLGYNRLLLIGDMNVINPAFYCRLIKRRHQVRLGGGLGIFFGDFEHIWTKAISAKERKLDSTLPIVMLIDNFIELIDDRVFRYVDAPCIEHSLRKVYTLTLRLPRTLDEFVTVLETKTLLGKPLHSYLHIRDYNEDSNLYLRKSVEFVNWFVQTYPEFADKLIECLTPRQIERVGSIRPQLKPADYGSSN